MKVLSSEKLQEPSRSFRPSQPEDGLVASLKEMHSSFLGLADAHGDHISQKLEAATDKVGMAVATGYILGPLITVFLGVSTFTGILYFGTDTADRQGLLQASLVAMAIILVAVFAAAFAIRQSTKTAVSEIKSIKSEFKRDFKVIGGAHEV